MRGAAARRVIALHPAWRAPRERRDDPAGSFGTTPPPGRSALRSPEQASPGSFRSLAPRSGPMPQTRPRLKVSAYIGRTLVQNFRRSAGRPGPLPAAARPSLGRVPRGEGRGAAAPLVRLGGGRPLSRRRPHSRPSPANDAAWISAPAARPRRCRGHAEGYLDGALLRRPGSLAHPGPADAGLVFRRGGAGRRRRGRIPGRDPRRRGLGGPGGTELCSPAWSHFSSPPRSRC